MLFSNYEVWFATINLTQPGYLFPVCTIWSNSCFDVSLYSFNGLDFDGIS